MFAFITVGVTGKGTTEIATIGLGVLGKHILILGNLFVVLAMMTSFLALALALMETFDYDLKMHKNISWFWTWNMR